MNDKETPILDAADIPQVALASMNQTHREEVELVNRLAQLVSQSLSGAADETTLSRQIQRWLGHTRDHFERENALMAAHGFPAYAVHKGEHDRILALLDDLYSAWRDHHRLEPLAEFLFETWHDWFDSHVNTMDRVTAQFISQQGGG